VVVRGQKPRRKEAWNKMRSIAVWIPVVVAVGVFLASPAHGKIVTLSAQADAYVEGGTPTVNYGAATDAQVKGTTGTAQTFTRKAYMRFNLPSPKTTQTSAQLTLTISQWFYGNSGAKSITIYGLNNLDPGEGWGEGTITWTNAPANNTGANAVFLTLATELGIVRLDKAPAAGTRVTLSNQALLNFINADNDNQVTFIVLIGQDYGQDKGYLFATKEFTPAGGEQGDWAPALKLSDSAPGTLSITTATGTSGIGADVTVRGTDNPLLPGGNDFQNQNFNGGIDPTPPNIVYANQVRVKASGDQADLGTARKGYFRLDLAGLGGFVGDAKLSLTNSAVVSGGAFNNSQPGNFRLMLYGLNADQNLDGWVEGTGQVGVSGATPPNPITWMNAPANINTTGADVVGLDLTKASKLAEIVLPANPGVNANPRAISNANSVSPNALLDFVKNPGADNKLTFILVALGVEWEPKDGFKFGSLEAGAPTLLTHLVAIDEGVSTNSLPPAADTLVRAGTNATSNFGNLTEVRVKAYSGVNDNRRGYFKFDVSSLPTTLTDVRFELNCSGTVDNNVGLIHALDLYVANDEGLPGRNWVEGSGLTGVSGATPPNEITWLNAPFNDVASPSGLTSGATLVAKAAAPRVYVGGTPLVEFANVNSVTPDALINAINSDTDNMITFIITAANEAPPNNGQTTGWQISTKEDGAPVTLAMTLGEICNSPADDTDGDGDVDDADVQVLVACMQGPGLAWTGNPVDQQICRCLDQDGDLDVDLKDYWAFQKP